MPHPALSAFTDRIDQVVATASDARHTIAQVQAALRDLLAEPAFLEDRFRRPREGDYAQHVVHVHPEGAYSVVSLVWLPGQQTAIHDHVSWCCVGVLQGQEHETAYDLFTDGQDRWLSVREQNVYPPGRVCGLVPPEEDIHRVRNDNDGVSISIHVYGADISKLGTSINHRFADEIRPRPTEGAPASWRQALVDTPVDTPVAAADALG